MRRLLPILLFVTAALASPPPLKVSADEDRNQQRPRCYTVGSDAPTFGDFEDRACLLSQYCNLWTRESCVGATWQYANFGYDPFRVCLYHCDFADGSYRVGISVPALWTRR